MLQLGVNLLSSKANRWNIVSFLEEGFAGVREVVMSLLPASFNL